MYDYIIIGAGSAGCVLANRLSANPNHRVLLLEAGGRDRNPFIHMPAGLSRLVRHSGVNWGYYTEPQSELHDRRLYWPRGKVLGGSSSINAMCYIRGQAEDYDQWAANGCEGWAYADLLPYFRKSENQQRSADTYHGVGGPLSVSDLRYTNRLSEAFIRAARQTGHPLNEDFNGPRQHGFGLYQVTQQEGRRCSTATGYLNPVSERENLTVAIRALALGLEFDGQRVTGVRYRKRGQVHTAEGGEVILCGGAINSPQLLMLSGIGPADHLRGTGIEPRLEVPGVGANLQDHLDVCLIQRSRKRITYDQPNELAIGFNYWLSHGGIGSSNIAEAGGFAHSSASTNLRPDIQMHFVPAQLDDHGRNQLPGHGYTVHACYLHPRSRGTIRLQSRDPEQHAAIDPCYLSDPADQAGMIEAARMAREILAAPAFADYRGHEIFPGEDVERDAEILEFIRRKAETIYHPVGTCKMGPESDAEAVVDPELRVHGLDGVRVVDASIMPRLISGNTNAPVIAIAEKIADMMLS